MSTPTLKIGNGEWFTKSGRLLTVAQTPSGEYIPSELTVTSGSEEATIINKNGYLEDAVYNLNLHSEDFIQSYWSKANISFYNVTGIPTPKEITSPQLMTNVVGQHNYLVNFSTIENNQTFTSSVYVKMIQGNGRMFMLIRRGVADARVNFDLNAGTITSTHGGGTGTIEALEHGWYRCSITATTESSGGPTPYGRLIYFETYGSSSANFSAYLAGFQFVKGSVPKAYQRIDSSRGNFPRISYESSSKGSILLEPARTNSCTYSENFTHSDWFANGTINITANEILSPFNTLRGSRCTTGSDWAYFTSPNISPTVAGSSYTLSIFAKAGNTDFISLTGMNGAFGTTAYANFDLNRGVVSTVVEGTARIKAYRDGWYRCEFTMIAVGNSTTRGLVITTARQGTGRLTSNIGDFVYIFGAQFELGTYATSYIPTLASVMTRAADLLLSDNLIEQSVMVKEEGTLYFNFNSYAVSSQFNKAIGLDDTSSITNYLGLYMNSATPPYIFIRQNDVNLYSSIAYTSGKVAIKFGAFGFKVFKDGTLLSTVTTPYNKSLSRLILRGISGQSDTPDVEVYKTALPDSKCIEITTL